MVRRSSFVALVAILLTGAGLAEAFVPPPPVPAYVSQFGGFGTDPGKLKDPMQIAVDPKGNVYVVEFANSRVSKFDRDDQFLLSWGGAGPSEGKMQFPMGIAISRDGYLYVADSGNNRIQVFTRAGVFVETWGWGVSDGSAAYQICTSGCQDGSMGSGNGQFNSPQWIAIEPITGQVYVSDTFNDRIQYFSSAGTYLGKWGSNGTLGGKLDNPTGLAIDPEANVFVADSMNNRIQQFSPDGDFMQAWGWGVDDGLAQYQVCTSGCRQGIQGDGYGQFYRPNAVTVDEVGRVWVSDTYNDRIQLFDPAGHFVTNWGATGSDAGEFESVVGTAETPSGAFFAAESGNDRVQRFQLATTQLSIKAPARAEIGARITVKGKVTSAAPGCVADQTVTLTGNGRILGTDRTSLYGDYAIRMRFRQKIMVWATYESFRPCVSSRSPRTTIRT